MDWRDTPDEAAFRDELRAWLEANVDAHRIDPGAPDVERAAAHKAWHRALHAGGWMGLSWPTPYGGRGLGAVHEAILNDEVGAALAPPVPHVGFLGRALLTYGTETQKATILPRLLSGEDTWCQGFSEPGAGSDLASLRTRATRAAGDDGDDGWSITGQKVWTSDGFWADRCLLLARTDPDVPKHRGISAFVLDLRSPGVDVRPIVLSNGDRDFCEVFLDDVRVPADAMVGQPGDGWALAMTTVSYERGPADVGFSSRYAALAARLAADNSNDDHDLDVVRARVDTEVLRCRVLRSLSARLDGSDPGPEGSIDKLLATRVEQSLHHLALRRAGAAALVGDDPATLADYLYSRAQSIAGGTSQIQRTLVAERVLGLPRQER